MFHKSAPDEQVPVFLHLNSLRVAARPVAANPFGMIADVDEELCDDAGAKLPPNAPA